MERVLWWAGATCMVGIRRFKWKAPCATNDLLDRSHVPPDRQRPRQLRFCRDTFEDERWSRRKFGTDRHGLLLRGADVLEGSAICKHSHDRLSVLDSFPNANKHLQADAMVDLVCENLTPAAEQDDRLADGFAVDRSLAGRYSRALPILSYRTEDAYEATRSGLCERSRTVVSLCQRPARAAEPTTS